jgi:peroxiredoxin
MKKLSIAVALSALLALIMVCAGPVDQAGSTAAPAFEVKDLGGQSLSLDQFKGHVLVLNFWATWCPPCREEIPDLISVYNQYKSRGLTIIGLSVDRLSVADLAQFVKDNGITYPVALATQKIVADFEPGQYIPATIVVDKKGVIRSKHVGTIDSESLESLFLKLDSEK